MSAILGVAAAEVRIATRNRWVAILVVKRHWRRVGNIANSEFACVRDAFECAGEFLCICLRSKTRDNKNERDESGHCVPPVAMKRPQDASLAM